MAAGLGFKTFTTGEVLTAADTNGYLMQGILVFVSAAARDASITSPQEGQFAFLKDTNVTYYYDGAAWVVSGATGDITAVTAGKGLTGGGASGDVTVSLATTAKGDLVVGTGASTAGVLSVSSDGSTIVADSSTSTGLRYQGNQAAGRNAIINGGMDIWQRGTSFSSPNAIYVADRWKAEGSTPACTVSRQATGDTTNLPNIQYNLRFQRNSGQTNTTAVYLYSGVETANAIPYAGKAIVVSFYARAGANYSSASSILSYFMNSGTGTDESPSGGYTGNVSVASGNVTLTTTWQRFTYTGTLGSTATEFKVGFNYTPVGTAGANDYFDITGVQVELGSVATPFSRSGATIQGELAACQRYYFRWITTQTNGNIGSYTGICTSTTQAQYAPVFPTTMRIAPTSLDTNQLGLLSYNAYYTGGTWTLAEQSSPNTCILRYTHGSAALTGNQVVSLISASGSAGYVGLSSEL